MPSAETNNKSLAFISDWQKRAAAQQRTFAILLAFALLAVVIISDIGFLWFQDDNYERIIDHNMNYVEDSALQEANSIERSLNETVNVIRKFAKQYSILEHQYPNTTIEDRLSLLWDRTLFDRVAYVSPDGLDISLEGLANVADRDYFQRAMQGESGYQLLEKSRVTGRLAMIFYTPIYHNAEITGVMLGFHERERIDHQLTYQFLNYQPNTYLLQGDGTIIGSSNDMFISENAFAFLENREYPDEVDYAEIRAAIASPERTSIAFTFINGDTSSVGVIAQFLQSDMMVFTVMPSAVTDSMINAANHSGKLLLLYISIAFLILFIVCGILLVRQRQRMNEEMTLATESLKETLAHDQMQTFVIESLGNTYSSVYYINRTNNECERISEENQQMMLLPDKSDWTASFRAYLDQFVDEDHHDEMQRLFDLKKFEENLGADERISLEYRRKDGTWRKAFLIPAEQSPNGDTLSVIFAVQKIDAEKQRELETKRALQEAYEAAQLASSAKTTFLSNISHDIRTPMNAIVGMTAIAGANLDNQAKVADCLKKINISSKHLLGIINEVLDMSKIETGRVDLSEEEFHLPDLFDELISINQPLVRERKHSLSVTVNTLEHENVIGDSVRLQQVFTNLLTNAIKYTPEGGTLKIFVSEKPTNKPNIGWYEVVFCDNGIGMSEEFQKTMFEPFTRAKDNRIAAIQGTGLGMPIARNIIRMMNGDITVESKLDEGSTFTVSFALRLQTDTAVDYAAFVDLPVLVVDDDLLACESTCAMLDSLSMHSEYVTNGKEAVEKTIAHHQNHDDYYAVIVDWQMPEMNGIETARAIRKQVGQDVPIIVISAYDWTEIEKEARAAGVNAFLSKPLFKSRLVNLFAELVGTTEKTEPVNELREQDFSGKRILLAEDNELNREIAVEIFSMLGMETDTAENGRLCLETFTASEVGYYDLIFMDIQMPEMDGYEATTAIRMSDHPQAKTIPIVAMSANAFSTDVRAAINSGMNGHVAKPIDISAIIKVLNEML